MDTTTIDFTGLELLQDDNALQDIDNQGTFDNLVVPEELAHLKDVGHLTDGIQPIAIFVVGQTGAGKTRLAADLLVVADMLMSDTDPEYANLNKNAPHLASPVASTDTRKSFDLATTWVIQRRLDVLLECACRRPEDCTSLIPVFSAAGYKVLVAIMGVPESLSLLGTMVRYYERLPEAESAHVSLRISPRKAHNETYASAQPPFRKRDKRLTEALQDGILAAADLIDSSPGVTNVMVVRRNDLVSYQNYRGSDGLWVRPASALASLDLERTRPPLAAEHSSFLAACQYLGEQEGNNGLAAALAGIFDDAEASLAGLMSIGGHLSSSYPALKPLDIYEWVFGA